MRTTPVFPGQIWDGIQNTDRAGWFEESDPNCLDYDVLAAELIATQTVVHSIVAHGTGLVWLGAWSPLSAYIISDGVEHNGSSYIAVANNLNSEPPSANWNLLASKGAQGDQGPQGDQGDDGPTGPQGDAGADGAAGPQGDTGVDGATGPSGPAGATGPVGLTWRGDWLSTTSYLTNDAVQHNGSAWVALQDSDDVEPPTLLYWGLLASVGNTGATGPQGDAGAAGPSGPTGPEPSLPATNALYVDNKRGDAYTESGSILKPFKTIQAAMNAVSGSSTTNRFAIRISPGADYTEAINYNKDQAALVGDAHVRLTGAITINTAHAMFSRLNIRGPVTCNMANHFLIEVDHCNIATGAWNIAATAPAGDEWLQIYGGIFGSSLTCTGLGGAVGWLEGGVFQGSTLTVNNCANFQATGSAFLSCAISIENGTAAILGGCMTDMAVTCTLRSGATLISDAASAGYLNIVESGGTYTGTTTSTHVLNSSNVPGKTVTDALNDIYGIVTLGSVAGEALKAGHLVYTSPIDGLLYKASSSTEVTSRVCGFCKEDTDASDPCTLIPNGGLELANWTLVIGTTYLTPGVPYFLSATSGQITDVAPVAGYTVQVALAVTTTELDINILKRVRI